MKILLILLVAMISATAQLCQKQAMNLTASKRKLWLVWLASSISLLLIALLLWLWILTKVAVGIAYPILSLNLVLVVLGSRWCWGEMYYPRQWYGVIAIVLGVGLMAWQVAL